MFKLDDNFLQEIGLGALPATDKNAMLQHIYETLELRVGMRLAEQMTDAQLDEFEGFIDRNDEPGALKWLETNLPHYKQVVAEELDKLKGEISANAPQIIQASQQQAQNAQMAAGQPPAQGPQAAPAPQQPVGYPPQGAPSQFGSQPAPQPEQPPAPAPNPNQFAAPAPQQAQPMQPPAGQPVYQQHPVNPAPTTPIGGAPMPQQPPAPNPGPAQAQATPAYPQMNDTSAPQPPGDSSAPETATEQPPQS